MIDDDLGLTPARSAAELAELEALRAEQRGLTARHLRTDDSFDALRDAFFAAHAGARPSPHPGARRYLRDGFLGLRGLAEEVLALRGRNVPAGDGFGATISALSTPDFPTIVSETARGISAARSSVHLPDILALTAPLEVQNYNSQSYSSVDIEGVPTPGSLEYHEFSVPRVRLTGEEVQIASVFARLIFSRQAIVNDDRNYFASAVRAFVAACHRNEMRMLIAKLEANANLTDGRALFNATDGNLITGSGEPSATTIKNVIAALRNTSLEGGDAADCKLAVLLVPAELELSALTAARDLFPPSHQPSVVSSAYLSDATSWYAFADPMLFPTIGRVKFVGADDSAVSFSGLAPAQQLDPQTGKTSEYNGLALEASHSVGFSVLGRAGAVKVTV